MISTDKLIISVATTGSFMTKQINPNIPITPNEIAEEVYRSWNEGASIAHIHARDENGKSTTNPAYFREIKNLIREKGCDIIIQFSTSPGREPTSNVNDGFRVLEAEPEMASVDIGVIVFMREGEERLTPWTRSFDEKLAREMENKGIKPEFETYGIGGILELEYLIENVPLTKPYWVNLVMDMQRTVQNTTPYSPKNMLHIVEQLPTDSMFTTMGVGRSETSATVQSILLGGHARVGFEDNIYYSYGVMAKSNAELVSRIARIGKDLGRTVSSPNETRNLLGIPEFA